MVAVVGKRGGWQDSGLQRCERLIPQQFARGRRTRALQARPRVLPITRVRAGAHPRHLGPRVCFGTGTRRPTRAGRCRGSAVKTAPRKKSAERLQRVSSPRRDEYLCFGAQKGRDNGAVVKGRAHDTPTQGAAAELDLSGQALGRARRFPNWCRCENHKLVAPRAPARTGSEAAQPSSVEDLSSHPRARQ